MIQRIEIIVVKGQPYRKALDDKRRKLLAVASPLLFRVSLDELFKNITAYQRDSLLFQILRLALNFRALFLNFFLCLFRCHDAPHFVKRIHIKRHRIQLALIIGYRTVGKPIEVGKLRDVFPHLFVVCVEDMRAVPMHMNAFDFFCINISSYMRALINHQHRFSRPLGFLRKYSAVQSGADN